MIAHDYQLPYAWQNVIGFQKQLSAVMSVESDLVLAKEYNIDRARDINLFYDPANGLQQGSDGFRSAGPEVRPDSVAGQHRPSDYLALSTGLTRRFRDNFQFNASHTLMFYKHDNHQGAYSFTTFSDNSFNPDDEWARSSEFQRQHAQDERDLSPAVGDQHRGGVFLRVRLLHGDDDRRTPVWQAGNQSAQCRRSDHREAAGARPVRGPRGHRHAPDHASERVARPAAAQGRSAAQQEHPGRTHSRHRGRRSVQPLNHDNFGTYNGQVNSTTFGDVRQSIGNAYVPRLASSDSRLPSKDGNRP